MGIKFPIGNGSTPADFTPEDLQMIQTVVEAVADMDIFDGMILAALAYAPCSATERIMQSRRKELLAACSHKDGTVASPEGVVAVAASFNRFVILLVEEEILVDEASVWKMLRNKVTAHRSVRLTSERSDKS